MAGPRHVTRRDFLAQAAAAPAAWPLLARVPFGATPRRQVSTGPPPGARGPLVAFDEPDFPVADVPAPATVPGAISTTDSASLLAALAPGAVLVWRHGPAFPADAWEGVLRFLEDGGSLLHLGGEPFTRLATGRAGARRLEPRSVSCLSALRLGQSYRVDAAGATLHAMAWAAPDRVLPPDAWAAALEPRFTDTTDFPSESGSPGARDARVEPFAALVPRGGDARFPSAAAAYAIDRLRGRFAGGRWVLWLLSEPPAGAELAHLMDEAVRPPVEVRVDPTFGCFYAGERPSVLLRVHRPSSSDTLAVAATVSVTGPGAARAPVATSLDAGEHATARVDLGDGLAPGLHRVAVDMPPLGRAETGFWVFDAALFASGDALAVDARTLRRRGRPDPVVGTTVMSATVHRDFLFEPNAAVWDDTFAELASIGVNLVRTGFWSGWKKIALEADAMDEGVVRALQAYYLTARAHGIPVLFNAFAFTPDAFGGLDPYFDPRALEGQRAFLATLAGRMAPARELLWDLINEPSFASPDDLWSLRPSRSPYERRAFLAWLAGRYATPGAPHGWEDAVRRRWRLRPDEAVDLPADEDFADTWIAGARRPCRALDYALFAQDAFARWIGDMRAALREGGSTTLVTVGQDEAGLTTSPGPLFHHAAVDFTSIHTWWNDDALLWDGVMAKPAGAPLLVSETGVMQRTLASGEAVRTPDEFANLLSRKIGYAFASGAFGVVEWIYDVDPYLASDNEAAIGLRRVDGSVKPEHAVLAGVAAFVARNRARFDGGAEPDVALLVPTGDLLSTRNTAQAATRAAVRACYETLGVRLAAVPDHRADRDLRAPRAIVLPACRGVSDAAWAAVTARVEDGATLVCSGWFETDDAGLPAERLGGARRPLRLVERAAGADGAVTTLRFPGTLPESWYAAEGDALQRIVRGKGTIVHHPLPIEWAEPTPAVAAFYRAAFGPAGVTSPVAVDAGGPGVVVVTLPFREAWLAVAVNESGAARRVQITRSGGAARLSFDVPAARARMAWIDPEAWRVVDLSP